jgi:hypothetical protein
MDVQEQIAAASEAQTTDVEERLTALEKKMSSTGESRFLNPGIWGMPIKNPRFFADGAAKKWPLRGSLKGTAAFL